MYMYEWPEILMGQRDWGVDVAQQVLAKFWFGLRLRHTASRMR